jgi:uncharacterized membrane protein YfcA
MLPDYPPAFWLCAVLAMIIFGISKAGFGGGIGVIATPLVSLTIPVTDAVALLLPLLIITDVFSISHYRMHFHRRSIKLLLPGALLGVAIGGLFLSFFRGNERVLQIAIGVVALWFVLFQTLRAIILGMLEKRRPRVSKGVLMGALSGFTSTVAHAGGPPFTMYLLPQKFPRDLYVGTAVIFFAVVNLVKLIPYYALGFLRVGNLSTIIILGPLTYVGVRLGIYLNRRFTDLWFNRAVYAILVFTGLQLVSGKNIITMLFG